MLLPKRVKYRKAQRGRMRGIATRGNTIAYGDYAMQALEPAWITSNQIEAARIAMTRYSKRGGKVWIKIFPDKPVTSKPAETRMGSGKGSPDYWVAVVKPGRVLFEISGVTEDVARESIRLAGHKLPCKVRFIKRETAAEAADAAVDAAAEAPVEAADAAVDAAAEAPVEAADAVVDAAAEAPVDAAADAAVDAAAEAPAEAADAAVDAAAEVPVEAADETVSETGGE